VADAAAVTEVYTRFSSGYVGMVYRRVEDFQDLLRSKPRDLRLGAFRDGRLVGYALGGFHKPQLEGVLEELVVDPDEGFTAVAEPLVRALVANLVRRGPALIYAKGCEGYPLASLLEGLGWRDVAATKTVMMAVVDEEGFVREAARLLSARAESLEVGVTLVCGGRRVVVKEGVSPVVLRVQDVRGLARLIFGLDPPDEGLPRPVREALFPGRRYLTYDFW
jgi:hypothetical protein